jgi:hypothetical protein
MLGWSSLCRDRIRLGLDQLIGGILRGHIVAGKPATDLKSRHWLSTQYPTLLVVAENNDAVNDKGFSEGPTLVSTLH